MTIDTQRDLQAPSWLPGVVKSMLPNFAARTPRERAVLHRLTHDARMRRVWAHMARLEPLSLSAADAMRTVLAVAYFAAVESRPVMLEREREQHMRVAGDWGSWFTSTAFDDVVVSHLPADRIAKRFQLTLANWFKWAYGDPLKDSSEQHQHLGLVKTITEVALDRHVSRYAGRLRERKPSMPKPRHAPVC